MRLPCSLTHRNMIELPNIIPIRVLGERIQAILKTFNQSDRTIDFGSQLFYRGSNGTRLKFLLPCPFFDFRVRRGAARDSQLSCNRAFLPTADFRIIVIQRLIYSPGATGFASVFHWDRGIRSFLRKSEFRRKLLRQTRDNQTDTENFNLCGCWNGRHVTSACI